MKIKFPLKREQRYYDLHFRYMLGIFAALGWEVEYFEDDSPQDKTYFKMYCNNKPMIVDFSDYGLEYLGDEPCLRFHAHAGDKSNIIPFAPGSFWDWGQYAEMESQIKYNAEGLVLHNQRPHCNNTERRNYVRRMVEDWCDKTPGERVKGQSCTGRVLNGANTEWHGCAGKYWLSMNNCLVSIHVPGQNNNMLDSAQLQLMGFGVCTISPNLPDLLPFGKQPLGFVHYIPCKDDYSDLREIIDRCFGNKGVCRNIGKDAKELFKSTCTPQAIGKWMEERVRAV